ncbi:MAG: DUF2785 domain-containing protein [Thermaerobacter sp.]|nr:DUF2785 domain-containing protein [Thermaerobacter sp.]
MDQSFWLVVRESGFALPEGHDLMDLTEELLGWLGSPDPALRDEIAYFTLAHWFSQDLYSSKALHEIGQRMVQNLERGLGEVGTDSVFLRTFSILVLGEVVAVDAKHPALPEPLLRAWREAAENYLQAERDARGFVPGRGWAHAPAHTADCLAAFATHPRTDADGLRAILHAVADRVLLYASSVFLFDEDQRLANTCLRALQRTELTDGEIGKWCERFGRPRETETWRAASGREEGARTYLNVKSFLRSVYFQVLWTTAPPPLRESILDHLLVVLCAIGTGPYDQ